MLHDNIQKLLDPSENGVDKNVLKHSESAFRNAILNYEIIKELYQRLENICEKNISPAINLIEKTSCMYKQFGFTNETHANMTNAKIHLGIFIICLFFCCLFFV